MWDKELAAFQIEPLLELLPFKLFIFDISRFYVSNFKLQMINLKLIENKIAHVNLFNSFVYNPPTIQVNRLTC